MSELFPDVHNVPYNILPDIQRTLKPLAHFVNRQDTELLEVDTDPAHIGEEQVFTRISAWREGEGNDSDLTFLFEAKGPGADRLELEEGSALFIGSRLDKTSVEAPEGMTSPEALQQLRQDLPNILAALQKQQAESMRTAEMLESRQDIADFGRLFSVGPVDPAWFVKRGLDPQVAHILNNYNLSAAYSQRVGKHTTAWFSPSWSYGDRSMIQAYVLGPHSCDVSLFYQSNSRAVWRWLPGFDNDPEKPWFSKGQAAEAMTVPRQLQRTLAYVDAHTLDKNQRVRQSQVLYQDSVVPYASRYDLPKTNDALHFIDEPRPNGQTEAQDVDFSNCIDTFTMNTTMYGQVVCESYPNRNGSQEYMFIRNAEGKAWLASVFPTKAPLRRRGLVYDTFTSGVDKERPFIHNIYASGNEHGAAPLLEYAANSADESPLVIAYRQASSKSS